MLVTSVKIDVNLLLQPWMTIFVFLCALGAGLLQHYIREGKRRDDIVKITYQFCVSLKIQTPRVCEGITELFGVGSDIALLCS